MIEVLVVEHTKSLLNVEKLTMIDAPKLSASRAYFYMIFSQKMVIIRTHVIIMAKHMYCEADAMKDVCVACNRKTYCLEPCEQ